jgi:GWxTD domain-containing protein
MRRLSALLAFWLVGGIAFAETVPELFQKVKEQVKAGSWNDALVTMEVLSTEAAKPANQQFQSQLEAPLAFYRGVCEANVDQADKAAADFETFQRLQPNASIDDKVYSKKAVAAFAQAQKTIASAGPSLSRAYQDFRPPAAAKEPVNKAWIDGPVVWIMSDGEKAAWAQLTTDPEREAFVDKFWLARDSEDDHSFRPTFDKRVAFADANFSQKDKSEKRGSLTDRGMVFVVLGPPTYGGRRRLKQGEDQSENRGMSSTNNTLATIQEHQARTAPGATSSGLNTLSANNSGPGTNAPESSYDFQEAWHYRKELLPKGVGYLQVDAIFITKKGYGMYVLQRDSDILTTLSAAKKKPE